MRDVTYKAICNSSSGHYCSLTFRLFLIWSLIFERGDDVYRQTTAATQPLRMSFVSHILSSSPYICGDEIQCKLPTLHAPCNFSVNLVKDKWVPDSSLSELFKIKGQGIILRVTYCPDCFILSLRDSAWKLSTGFTSCCATIDSVRWDLLFHLGFQIVVSFVKLGSRVSKVKFQLGFKFLHMNSRTWLIGVIFNEQSNEVTLWAGNTHDGLYLLAACF